MGTSVKSVAKYGHRKVEHQEWLERMTEKGYTASDWVVIIAQGLTKTSAAKLEQSYIREERPLFNSPIGKKLLALSEADVKEAECLRVRGLSYKRIAEQLGCATMTVWRTLTGVNKNAV
jgi:DNA-directed RNA polymerase specialized sigma24 family protein